MLGFTSLCRLNVDLSNHGLQPELRRSKIINKTAKSIKSIRKQGKSSVNVCNVHGLRLKTAARLYSPVTNTAALDTARAAALYLLDLGLQWMSHVVAVGALFRALSKAEGKEGRLRARSAEGKQLKVKTMERRWWGYGSAAAPSHGSIPGAGEARWPPTGKRTQHRYDVTV